MTRIRKEIRQVILLDYKTHPGSPFLCEWYGSQWQLDNHVLISKPVNVVIEIFEEVEEDEKPN